MMVGYFGRRKMRRSLEHNAPRAVHAYLNDKPTCLGFRLLINQATGLIRICFFFSLSISLNWGFGLSAREKRWNRGEPWAGRGRGAVTQPLHRERRA